MAPIRYKFLLLSGAGFLVFLLLPWTVQDEDTWVVAHRLLGYCALPLLLCYLGGLAAGLPLGELTMAVWLLWVAIPGGLSYLFFRRKWMV